MAPTIPRIDLRMEDLDRLVDRTRHTPLTDDEYATLKAAIDTLGYVAQLLEQKGTTLAGLRQLLFGATTEKTRDVLARAGVDLRPPDASGNPREDAAGRRDGRDRGVRGHGRHGADAYVGARHVAVPHGGICTTAIGARSAPRARSTPSGIPTCSSG